MREEMLLQLLVDTELVMLKRKAWWWIFSGIAIMFFVAMPFMMFLGSPYWYWGAIYVLPYVIAGILVLVNGILHLVAWSELNRRRYWLRRPEHPFP